MRFCIHVFFVFLVTHFFSVASAIAGTRLLVPQQYPIIQSAINAAHAGDTVLVDHGLYYENLRITKNIILASRFILDRDTSHISRTIIDGSRARNPLQGSTIYVTGRTDTSCIITGLTIRGGTGTYVYIPNDPIFQNWLGGGGICVVNAGVRISHNTVCRNRISSIGTFEQTGGAGISACDVADKLTQTSFVIIEYNSVVDNTLFGKWTEAPGISVAQPAIVRHNTIVRNSSRATQRAPGGGLGLYFSLPYDIVADGNDIRYNSSGIGGGILVGIPMNGQGRAIIVNNIIAYNDVFEVGGGVHVAENGWAILLNNTIVGNHAGATGSGLNIASGGMATIVNNIFWKNDPRPITSLTSIRAVNNLIEGGFRGQNTIDADPLFVPNDSSFRLLAESPAVGTGAREITVGRIPYPAPPADVSDTPRPSPAQGNPDIGAVESPFASNAGTADIYSRWEKETASHLRVTIMLRQVSRPVFNADSTHVIRAGRFSGQVIVNEGTTYHVDSLPAFTLPPHTNVLEVELLIRGLNESRRLNSYFQLEGLDANNSSVSRTRAYGYRKYVDIPSGMYRLTFYPADEFGLFDVANIKSLTVTVLSPWYQRWWAYTLLALTVAGLITSISLYEIRRLRRERLLRQAFTQQQMEFQEFERKRLAAELHDGLGQDLLVVNSELKQFARNGVPPDGELTRLQELVQDSIDAVREITSNLHPHHLERLGFCAAIEAMVERLSRSSGIAIECQCEEPDSTASMETKIHLYRIIQEALTNVVKHSQATSAQVTVRRTDRKIEVSVHDNGRGIEQSRPTKSFLGRMREGKARGFGLASMTERARILGGVVTIQSEPGEGTTIHLTISDSRE